MRVLSVDLGSSSCRAAILSEGRILGNVARRSHSLLQREPLDPEEALGVVAATIGDLLVQSSSPEVDAIGLSTFLAFCFLDASGELVAPCAPYCQRGDAADLERLLGVAGGLDRFGGTTGRRPAVELAAARLTALVREEPSTPARIVEVTSLKDWIVEQLTRKPGIDLLHANYTGLYDVVRRRPWTELIEETGLSPGCLGPIEEPTAPAGTLTVEAARRLGLPTGLPVVRGSVDGTTAMYGSGVLLPEVGSLICGTTDVIMAHVADPLRPSTAATPGDRRGSLAETWRLTWNNAVGGGYLVGGATALSGGALAYLERLFGGLPREEQIAGVGPGAQGLRILPSLAGERSPFWLPEASGAVYGWQEKHRREHFFRAVMEATACRVAVIARELMRSGAALQRVRLSGGAAASGVWNRIRAATLRSLGVEEVVVLPDSEATLMGTALYCESALTGTGLREISRRRFSTGVPVEVDPGWVEAYAGLVEEYERLYRMLEV
jgi:sugar (pentulose or hexulose) kinase